MRSTLLSPIQRSGLSLPTSAVRPCSLARRPTLEGTSPTTLRSGPRWSSSQGLRRIDAAEHSINPVLRTVRGTDVRELPRNSPSCVTQIDAALLARQKAEADLRDLYRERALDGAE